MSDHGKSWIRRLRFLKCTISKPITSLFFHQTKQYNNYFRQKQFTYFVLMKERHVSAIQGWMVVMVILKITSSIAFIILHAAAMIFRNINLPPFRKYLKINYAKEYLVQISDILYNLNYRLCVTQVPAKVNNTSYVIIQMW